MFGPTDVIVALGKRGSGKSTLCKAIARGYRRLVIFDRMREHHKGREAGTWEVETWEGFKQAVIATADLASFKLIIHFDVDADDDGELFESMLEVIYHRGDCCVLIEETHAFANKNYIGKWFRECMLTGRHQKLALILNTQRPAELHKTCIAQAHHVFCAVMHEPNDLNYLKTFLGSSAAERLPKLGKFRFLHYCNGEIRAEVTA